MNPSEKCLELIRKFDGLKLQAYKDPSGMWAIGYNHVGSPAEEGKVISQEEAENLLRLDINNVGSTVLYMLHVPVTQNMFDALCSLAFSVGTISLQKSWLITYLNNGSYDQVAVEIPRWVRQGDDIQIGRAHV